MQQVNVTRKSLACLLFLGYGGRKDINTASHYGIPVKRNERDSLRILEE